MGFPAGTRVFGGMYVTVVPWTYIELENDMKIDLYHPGLGRNDETSYPMGTQKKDSHALYSPFSC